MQYREDKKGNKISILGYGCMRFSQTAGIIDVKKTEKELLLAVEKGVNYFDTAYIYPGSETALGEIAERNGLREKINIATKLPHYLIKNENSAENFFLEELKRLRTDHVDYYLMHMLTDVKTWERLSSLGIPQWLEQKKASGAIGQVGFSYHGNSDMFLRLLEVYPWDFCQIQYNYLDEHSQAGVTGLKRAAELGIPVIIMEPLRGGRLVSGLPKKAKSMIAGHTSGRSAAEWSFDWLWSQPEVTCVLSGMNSSEMVAENTQAAENFHILAPEDYEFIEKIKAEINEKIPVPCTGCRYCMPCPKGVDIPGIFSALNRSATDGTFKGLADYVMCTQIRSDYTGAYNCISCGLCEKKCPQGISIRENLKTAGKKFEKPLYKGAVKILKKVMKY